MNNIKTRELILQTLKEKSSLKQDVFQNTKKWFQVLKGELKKISADLSKEIAEQDKRIVIEHSEKGAYAIRLKIAGDMIIFHMHTNVFQFDNSNAVWKTSYLKDEPNNGYCGTINIYNFLADSFKFNREQDIGYLIARVFINREGHFMVQGKRQLGFLYNDLMNSKMDVNSIRDIIESAILYTLDFDLLAPPYDHVNQVTLLEMKELSSNMHLSTGKRLGFRFQSDSDMFEG